MGFLKDRITINAGWYRNRTGNQLVGYALPGITGFATIQANLPAVVQNTGTELDLTIAAIQSKGFSWNISGNLTVPKNKLVAYPNLASSSYATRYVIGQTLFIQYAYHYIGLNPDTRTYILRCK